jgi:transposase InsO family protein
MPFKETCAVEERVRFCVALDEGEATMSELCRQFNISRKTGYEVYERWRLGGAASLLARSHIPHHCPHAVDEARRAAILGVRHKHATWGPKKVKAWLEHHRPETMWPAASTIGDILNREGLTVARKKRARTPARTAPFSGCDAPNDVWSMDFKGWFRTGNGERCDPFTLQDQMSRFLLRTVPVARTDSEHVWAVLDSAFREFGLPARIRSDNGPPFASCGAGGLSPLSVLLLKAGVMPERIDPGSPQQNGRLERLHLTLLQDTASPPAASLRAQAERFRAFRKTYNEDRPHEALGLVTPASVYAASPRPWSGRLRSPEYAAGVIVRRVRTRGLIKWRGGLVYVSPTLYGEPVGIEETEDGRFEVRYGALLLGDIMPDMTLRRPRAVRAPGRRCRVALRTHSAQSDAESVTYPAG